MYNQLNTKLELLLVNIRSFVKMRIVKQLKRGSSIVKGLVLNMFFVFSPING